MRTTLAKWKTTSLLFFVLFTLLIGTRIFAAPFTPSDNVIDPGALTPSQQVVVGGATSCGPTDPDCYVTNIVSNNISITGTILNSVVNGISSVVDITNSIFAALLPNTFSPVAGTVTGGDTVLSALGKLQGTNAQQTTDINSLVSDVSTLNSANYTNGLNKNGTDIGLGGTLINQETFIDGDGSETQKVAFGANMPLGAFLVNSQTANRDGLLRLLSNTQEFSATESLTLNETTNGTFFKIDPTLKSGLAFGTKTILDQTATVGQVLTLIDSDTGETEFQSLPQSWLLGGNSGTIAGSNFLGTTDAQDLVFKANNSEGMRLATSGNVGIGTATPGSKLHINTTTAGNFGIRVQSSDLSGNDIGFETYSPLGQEMKLGHWSGAVQFYSIRRAMDVGTAGNQALSLQTAASTRLRINGTGEVGIGGTAAVGNKLLVTNNGAKTTNTTGTIITNSATSSTASLVKTGLDIQSTGIWNGLSSQNIGLRVSVSGGATNYSALFNGGNVGIGNTAPNRLLSVGSSTTPTNILFALQDTNGLCEWDPGSSLAVTCSSDERLKKNIADADPTLDDLNLFNVRKFDLKVDDTHYNYGVIAQEVLQTHPEMVHMRENGMYGVEEISTWKLTKGIQELFNLADSFKLKLATWFADSANGIQTFFADIVKGRSIQAEQEVCIGSTCITESQLQLLLLNQQGGGSAASGQGSPDITPPSDTPNPTDETPIETPAEIPADSSTPNGDIPADSASPTPSTSGNSDQDAAPDTSNPTL